MPSIANTVSNTSFRELRSKVNEVIFVVNGLGVGNVSNSYLTSTFVTNSAFQSALANTNISIRTRATWNALTTTNTVLRSLISDRIQVANVANKYATKAYAASNAYVKLILANTNSYIADVESQIAAANEIAQDIIDYGFITSSVDVDTLRDYGTL
jgi:hypothetical protein